MVHPFELKYTEAAKRLIALRSNMETMNGKVLSELLEIFEGSPEDCTCVKDALIFHTVFFDKPHGDDGLFVTPISDHVLEVDAVSFSDGPELTEGPFAGMKIKMPYPEGKE